MEIKKVLVVFKKSRYEIFNQEIESPKIEYLIDRKDPASLRLLYSHQENLKAQQKLKDWFAKNNIENVWLNKPTSQDAENVDLVVSLGGDGTLLEAGMNILKDIPLMGINSSPTTSVGYLCATNILHFEEAFEKVMQDKMEKTFLSRIEIQINEKTIQPFALNDILFSHTNPAATSNYEIQLGNRREVHRSSGIWISTAAGSTAAIHSAGGQVMPIQSNLLQYRVRELYRAPNEEPLHLFAGFVEKEDFLQITSHIKEASLYLDGHWFKREINYGDVVTFQTAKTPLQLFGNLR